MLGRRALALLPLAVFASAQSLESMDPCAKSCYDQALANAASYGCAADVMSCMCPNAAFNEAIRACAERDCAPGYMPAVTDAVNAVCATATLPPGVPVPTETTEEPAPTPTTTEAPTEEPTEAPTSTSESSSEAPSTTAESSSPSSTSSAVETSTTSSAESTTTSEVAAATTEASSTTSSGSAAGAASTSDAPVNDSGSDGLGQAAKIGIGVGIGAAVIALTALGVFLFMRRRGPKKEEPPSSMNNRYKISHPMPNSEHAYTYSHNNSEYDIGGGSELESKSRRYEDMLPREEPRQMV